LSSKSSARDARRRSEAIAAPLVASKRAGLWWLAGAVAFAIGAAIVFYRVPSGSAAFFEYVGRSVLKGNLPYRDIWDNKLPSIYYLSAFWQLAFGERYVLHWAAQLGVLLATAALFASFARGEGIRSWGPAAFALSILLSLPPLQHFGYTEPYAVALIMAALVAAQRGSPIASGILLCLAATFWIPSSMTAIALLVYLPDAATRARFLATFTISALVYAGVVVLAFGPSAIASLLHDMRSYEGLKSQLEAGTSKGVAEHVLLTLRATGLIVPLVIAAGLVRRPMTRTQHFAIVWLACSLAGAAVNLNFFQHYFIPSAAPLVFAIAAYADWAGISPVRRIVLVALVVALLVQAPAIAGAMLEGMKDERNGARLPVLVGRMLDSVLPPDSRILVYGTSDEIYLTSNRDAPGRFANTFGLTLTSPDLRRAREQEYLADVRRADAVVFDGAAGAFASLDALLRAEFTPVCVGRVHAMRILLRRQVAMLHAPVLCPSS
jgi:hypothetical protein